MTAIKEQRMMKRLIAAGGMGEGRWPTAATPTDLKNRQNERGELSLLEQAVGAAFMDMPLAITVPDGIHDPAVRAALDLGQRKLRQLTVRNVLAMEAQNQHDDLNAERLAMQRDAAATFSSAAAEAIIAEVAASVAELVGPEQADIVLQQLTQRIQVDRGRAVGTSITPDMEAAAMDATVPSEPESAG